MSTIHEFWRYIFPLKIYMWVERVLSGIAVLREASVGLACPFHCGSSVLPAFCIGLLSGLLFGLCLGLYLAHLVWLSLHRASSVQPNPVPAQVPEPSRVVSRVAGYLHERRVH